MRSVLCEKHFEAQYINPGAQRNHLKRKLNPIPTIHTTEALKTPSCISTPTPPRKAPKLRNVEEDQLNDFRKKDVIQKFEDLGEKHAPPGYSFKRGVDHIIYYKIEFDETTSFPRVFGSIKIDEQLHVQLQCNGNPIPLPLWFIQGTDAKLRRFSQLENFPNEISVAASKDSYSLIDELEQRRHYKPKGRPPYSSSMIRYALLLRYTSLAAYKQLLEKFPLPSVSLLNKLHTGGVDAMKAAKCLLAKNKISRDVILMFDEMYLQKGAQYHGGEFLGEDPEGNLYKGIVCFMIVGLKENVPYVIKASPEVSISGAWLADEIAKAISLLSRSGFRVRGVVSDNHSANVNAYTNLLSEYGNSDPSGLFIQHPDSETKTYLFYDNVHLLKNIRNNLLNAKKFVFPECSISIQNKTVQFPAGFISWGGIHKVFDFDSKLTTGNLRKAPKLTYRSLHPGNNKQSVPLALAIFHESTIAGVRSYFPERDDMAGFLDLINTWWTIANGTNFSANWLSKSAEKGDGRTDFFRSFADWLEEWSSNATSFCLTKATSAALIQTLRAQAALVDELLDSGEFKFVCIRKMQSDPLEKRYSQYRQMSGGRFLVGLTEVYNTERILRCRSLLKADVNFWEEGLDLRTDPVNIDALKHALEEDDAYILDAVLTDNSVEVASTIAGYIAKKLSKRPKCKDCKAALISPPGTNFDNKYFEVLSRGNLTVPSPAVADFVGNGFAILDSADKIISKFPAIPTKSASEYVLKKYSSPVHFTCDDHRDWGMQFSIKAIINIYNNNKQKASADKVRKDVVVGFKNNKRDKSFR